MLEPIDTILDRIQSNFSLDPEWMRRDANSIAWVAWRLEQTIHVSDPFDDDGIEIVIATSRVPLVRNVSESGPGVDVLLNAMNHTAVGSALVFDPEERCIYSSLTMIFHEETINWRYFIFQSYVMLQLIRAENQAELLAKHLGGEVASADAIRDVPDEMLSAAGVYVRPEFQEQNRFSNEMEFQHVAELCNSSGGFSAGASATGVTTEYQFSEEDSALGQLVSDGEHPDLGLGLLSLLSLPLEYDSTEEAAAVAGKLNLAEATRSTPEMHFGAWAVAPRRDRWCVAFNNFMPNALYRPGLIQDSFVDQVRRIRYWSERFEPSDFAPAAPVEPEAKGLFEIIKNRFLGNRTPPTTRH